MPDTIAESAFFGWQRPLHPHSRLSPPDSPSSSSRGTLVGDLFRLRLAKAALAPRRDRYHVGAAVTRHDHGFRSRGAPAGVSGGINLDFDRCGTLRRPYDIDWGAHRCPTAEVAHVERRHLG